MFFHGISFQYILKQYPVLSPRCSVREKNHEQLQDRKHLIQRFGFEPVHLLESTDTYPARQCLKECLRFGDTVFAFRELPLPFWQLSRHEIGVTQLNLRQCQAIFTTSKNGYFRIKSLFPETHLFYMKNVKKRLV